MNPFLLALLMALSGITAMVCPAAAQPNDHQLVPDIGVKELIYLGQPRLEVIEKLGQPNRCRFVTRHSRTHYTGYPYGGKTIRKGYFSDVFCYRGEQITVRFDEEGKVYSLLFKSRNYKTAEGIRVGSNGEELNRAFGEGLAAHYFNYGMGTVFRIEKGKVSSIWIYDKQQKDLFWEHQRSLE